MPDESDRLAKHREAFLLCAERRMTLKASLQGMTEHRQKRARILEEVKAEAEAIKRKSADVSVATRGAGAAPTAEEQRFTITGF